MFLYLKEKGFPSPNTYLPKEIKSPDILTYPLVVKPKVGRGSRDIYNVNNGNELLFFSRYVNEPIIQEYLGGQEYTVDMLSNRQGEVLAIVPRKRLLSKGVSIKGEIAGKAIEDYIPPQVGTRFYSASQEVILQGNI